ncbi:MAG: hypothetical protein Q4E76_02525 [Tissierellia bacterium]|nr:hypothetical protein [Tissierellia bacterium]
MDWTKSKNIFIIVLLVTNLILLGLYFSKNIQYRGRDESWRFGREVKKVLERGDIHVKTSIPGKSPQLPTFKVAYESADGPRLNQRFFGGLGEITRNEATYLQLVYGEASVHFIDGRRLLYEAPGHIGQAVSGERAQQIALEFLELRGFDTQDMELVDVKEQGDEVLLSYTAKVKGHYLESTYTYITVSGAQVSSMDRLWVNLLEKRPEKRAPMPAAKALLHLLDQPEMAGKTIVDIAPCYYFNPEEQGAVEDLTRTLEGSSSVGWRLSFEDGTELVLPGE